MDIQTQKQLYQWDVNQTLTISCTNARYIDFGSPSETIRVEVTNGTARIPDEWLQTAGRKPLWVCMADNTIVGCALEVKGRPCPPDYVYTPTQRTTFDSLVAEVEELVNDTETALNAEIESLEARAESGEFDGEKGDKGDKGDQGDAYVISESDYEAIAEIAEAQYADDLKRTNESLAALWKLSEGITHTIANEVENGENVAPSGAEYETVMDIRGKSSQQRTTGYQLLNPSTDISTTAVTYAGRTVSNLLDGGFKCIVSSGASDPTNITTPTGEYIAIEPNTNYVVSGNISKFGLVLALYTEDKTRTRYVGSVNNASYTFTTDSTEVYCRYYVQNTETIEGEYTFYPMFEKGATAHSYEPYTGEKPSPSPSYPQTITTVTEINISVTDSDDNVVMARTITPPSELCSVGSGNNFACDVADIWSGKWVKKCKKYVFNGSENWNSSTVSGVEHYQVPVERSARQFDSRVYISCAIPKLWGSASEGVAFINGYNTFVIGGSDYISVIGSTTAELKAWLADNNVTLIYELETPVQTDIDAEDLAFMKSLYLLPADNKITITDQNGNDISYLVKYVINNATVLQQELGG